MTCSHDSASEHWHYLARGADAAEEVLTSVFGIRSAVRKDNSDPTSKLGFEKILRGMIHELMRTAQPHEEKALAQALHAIDVNWAGMKPHEITQALDDAGRAFGGVPKLLVQPVVESLTTMGVQTVTSTKAAAVGRYDLPFAASFNIVDQNVVDHAAKSHAFYVKDEFGKRQVAFSAIARQVVSRGLTDGLDSKTIGKDLKAAATTAMINRSDSYWTMIASVFATRSRTWGMLSSFEEAGIERYEISATLDEVSCDVCRFMDGQTFSVASAVSAFKKVAESDDPEAVVQHQPFMSVGMSESGDKGLFFGSGAGRQAVARVSESAVGEKDALGKFSGAMSGADLEKNGLSAPPFHGHCRCATIASFEPAPQQQEPARQPAVAPPVVAPVPTPAPVPVVAPSIYVDPNADIALPLPDGLIQPTGFVKSDGFDVPIFAGKRSAAQTLGVENIYKLPAKGDEVAFASGSLMGIQPAPGHGDTMPYADALRSIGTVGDIIAAHGEDFTVADAALSVVQATKRDVDRRAVASMIAKPLLAPDPVPTYIKWRGKIYLHAGHEELMAAEFGALTKSERTSKLIDLDKLGLAKRPDMKTWAAAIGRGIGSTDPAQQAAVREALREQLQAFGIATRDDRRGSSTTDGFPVAGSGLNEVIVKKVAGADASHEWSGRMTISQETLAQTKSGAALLASDPNYATWASRRSVPADAISDQLDGLRVLLHEEIHGASPAIGSAYYGIGVGIEEASTEILARKIARETVGLDSGWSLPRKDTKTGRYQGGFGSYTKFIRGLFDEVARHTGDIDIHSRIESAILETRKWHTGAVYNRGADQVRDFASRLRGGDGKALSKELRDKLVEGLTDPYGPFGVD